MLKKFFFLFFIILISKTLVFAFQKSHISHPSHPTSSEEKAKFSQKEKIFSSNSNLIIKKSDLFFISYEENLKESLFYGTPTNSKGFSSYLFGNQYFTARMSTFENTEIPFLPKGNGLITEFSTKSTNVSSSFFSTNIQTNENTILDAYKKSNASLASDAKLAFTMPLFPKLKFFGGYSYNKNNESGLIKGPSYGFQAAIFNYLKFDTTLVKPKDGKTSAKILLSLDMPLESFKF